MTAVDLGRLQFALTAFLHFSFVVVTLGLAPFLAYINSRAVFTRKPALRPVFDRMTRFWGQVYVINYALGIVTGLVMEFQFGLSWTGLSRLTGDVFGTTLAMETIVAFFVESTFLGLWIFGWHLLPRWAHMLSFYVVTATAYASAYWIMVTNGFLQNPVGFAKREDGTMYLTDLGALLTNDGALPALYHLAAASIGVGGFLIAGASAWHFLRGTTDPEVFRRSLHGGVALGLGGVWMAVLNGFPQLSFVGDQEGKSAAINGDAEALAAYQAEMTKLLGPGDWAPPEWLSTAFSTMQMAGYLAWTIGFVAACFFVRRRIERTKTMLRILVWTIPVPFVAVLCGWLIREMGRQPWAVYGEVAVKDALSDVSAGGMLFSLIAFVTVFAALAVVDWVLIARTVRRGTGRMFLGLTLADDPAGTGRDTEGGTADGDPDGSARRSAARDDALSPLPPL
ncbi:cytochrome ubiquinol oxidase subunit I [Streptomyces hydrogenans]|uniref:cytochrome ubiquinol oxidase subunit I n=1 Tax=Streptomyces hydrogenans TaxID=1873719 RepID=UPI003824CBBA